ncbi:MAG: radical SAM protein [Planctomycetota bacterium]
MARLSFDIDPVLDGSARLTEAQAYELYKNASLQDLGEWATVVANRMHPEDYRTYIIDRNINYTNVCTSKCTFCGFRRSHGDADSYVLTHEQIGQKIEELVSIGGTQILMQGGMNDALPIEYYLDLLRYIRTTFPTVHIHAFSPPEFIEFERFWGIDVRELIRRFKDAGLATIPGGGGEIFAERPRSRIGHIKASADDWLRVMRVAHEEGLSSSCTMMIGHIETVPERIDHMGRLRLMQDYALALQGRKELTGITRQAITRLPGVFEKSHIRPDEIHTAPGSYIAFIHWPFQRENVPLGRAKEYDPDVHGDFDTLEHPDVAKGRVVRSAAATEYLRMLGIARLFFDNVPSLQSSWVTMGPKIGQLALFYGANDMGGAMMEENVVSAAGTTYKLQVREICRLIRDAGYVPAQRDQYYNVLDRHDGPDSPDLQPAPDPQLRKVDKLDDKRWIGAAPGLEDVSYRLISGNDDGADTSTKLQLHVLGGDR